MATSNESQDPRQVHFLTIPWYSLGSQLDGRAKDNRYMNDNAVRARAGLLNMTAWTVTLLLFTVDKPKFILYSVGPIVLWDMVTASIFGLTPLSPYGILGTILTMKMKPVWKPAEPKRFAWTLGGLMVTACMAFGAMSLKDGSKVIAISCIGLTWLEAVLGFCLGCWMWNTYVAKLLGKEVCHECVMDFEDITPAVVPLGSLDATEGTKMVKDSIAAHPICVFSKSSCPHCIRAKNRLASLNIDYHVVELDSLPNPKAVAFALTDMTGRNTVPNIFIGGKSIGGASELIALADEGNLLPMVAQLGVQIDSPKAAQHDIEMGDVKTNL